MKALEVNKANNKKVSKFLWLVVDDLALTREDLSLLLGVPLNVIDQFWQKELPLPTEERYQRVGLLIRVREALQTLFPYNPEVKQNWLKTPRQDFRGLSALEMIAEKPDKSLKRLRTVAKLLRIYTQT